MAIKKFTEVTKEVLEVVLAGLEAPSFGFQQYFPLTYTSSLNWESLQVDGDLSVSADLIAHDSSANLKSRPDTKMQMGEIPKVSIINRVAEKTLHDYYALQNSPAGLEAEIYRIIFGDVRRGYEGVHMRMEHLAMQALSTGVAETDATNNEGVPFKATYAIPAANKTGVAVLWSNAATSKPISDLEAKVEFARSKGHVITSILMDRTTFNYLRNADATKALYSGRLGLNAGTLTPTLDNINIVLSAEGLPSIKIMDSTVNMESKAGVISTVPTWTAGYVTLLTGGTTGRTQWTQTAEEKGGADLANKNSISANRDIVRLTRWNTFDPYRILTKGEAVAFPVLSNVSQVYMMNTTNVTTWA